MEHFLERNLDITGKESAPSAIESIATEVKANTAAKAEAAADVPNPFAELGLSPALLKAISDLGYSSPTAVQARVIPLAMSTAAQDGQPGTCDLMVSSQTGSGKTAAFLLPILHRLDMDQRERDRAESLTWAKKLEEAAAKGEELPKKPRRKNPRVTRQFKPAKPHALILCPTRELAQQVANDAIDLVRHISGVRVATVIGGLPYSLQVSKLQNAALVVATPGRLLDLQRNGQIQCEAVKCLVLDEADRMLDLGFADDLAEIHALTGQREQTLMFSATFAPRIMELAARVMHEGGARVQRVMIDRPQQQHANIKQTLYWADNLAHKRKLLDHWMRDTQISQAIVFASTQLECDALAQDLIDSGFDAAALHGALNQGLRNRRLRLLRDGHIQFLVATDVAARGIDVPSISHVFNYGLPMKAEDYVHRIGRTGRAGRDGLAITFAEHRDRFRIREIEQYTQQPFKSATIAGLEPTERVKEKKAFKGGKDFNKAGGFGNKRGRSFGDKPARGFGSNAGAGLGGSGSLGGGFGERRDGRGDHRRDDHRSPGHSFGGDFAKKRPAEKNGGGFGNFGKAKPAKAFHERSQDGLKPASKLFGQSAGQPGLKSVGKSIAGIDIAGKGSRK